MIEGPDEDVIEFQKLRPRKARKKMRDILRQMDVIEDEQITKQELM